MQKFEEKLTELKKIVDELETGNVSLDESLKQFEVGTKLIKDCHKELEEFQRKISMLVENSSGEIEFKEFETDQD
ncbi:MAG: exodeoxyribonuclease VII small subunit [Thermodesulfobacteriota bacterium]